MLNITNLHASIQDDQKMKAILRGINLTVKPGEVHAIMGPNGSGKSTLANVLAGRDGYDITDGQVTFDHQDLLALIPEERAALGLFLAFQYPVEIPGVMLEPRLAILDETDSGLDIDALQMVAKGVNSLRNSERSIILVTHYQRLLDYIVPDFVHVMANGKIVKSGDKSLALELEAKGYGWLEGRSE
jgi:Fe-S cluster assembly ATP-binding protein